MFSATVLVGGTAFWTLRNFEPSAASWYPKCVFHQLTGLHCPGCGATRAMWALVHGDVVLAIRNNAMLVLGIPLLLAVIGIQRRRAWRGGKVSLRFVWTLFAVLMIYCVARNVPSPTASWLAPPPVHLKPAEP